MKEYPAFFGTGKVFERWRLGKGIEREQEKDNEDAEKHWAKLQGRNQK
jgi:hypothetical protein